MSIRQRPKCATASASLFALDRIFTLYANSVTLTCNEYYITSRPGALAVADLQPAREEDQREGRDMEKAPEVWNARIAQLRLRDAESADESGAARVAGDGNPGIQGRSLCASGPGNR